MKQTTPRNVRERLHIRRNTLVAALAATVALSLTMGTTAALAVDTQRDTVSQAATVPTTSLFGTAKPTVAAATDTSAVELGVKFTTSKAGFISAIKFYKAAGNGGTHTGSIWSSDGKKLAAVTFTKETASGWQTAKLTKSLAVKANQSYVVSYLAPQGKYSYTPNYFSEAKKSGSLSVPAAGNGRYHYGAAGGFPTKSWKSANYFVDVVFSQQPVTTPTTPAPAPTAVPAPTPTPAPTAVPAPTKPPTTTPPATTPPTTTKWPDASTTGVPAGVTLKPSGSLTITTPGAVVEGLDIKGDVFIRAANVTLKNSRVTGRVDTGDAAGKYPGTLIQRVEVIGPYNSAADGGYPAVGYTDLTCDGCNIRGWGKGAGLVANITIKNSWIHDLVVHGDPANGGSHNEAIISLGGTNFTITGNRLDAGSAPNFSASVALYSQMEVIRNVVVDRNLFNGGGYCLYAGSTNGKTATNSKFTNNTFGTTVFPKCGSYGPVTAYTSGNGNAWTGNVMSNGTVVNPG
jgi:hypothetical protein